LEQLPAHVQQKIRFQVGSAPIEDIDRNTRNGQVMYEVAHKDSNGQTIEQLFDQNGNALTSAAPGTVDSRKITYN
jgi:hypothetical protein